jgi:glycosyltransferase involved in cell wall biosynthesis
MKLSLILWDGNVGGAEKLTAELAAGLAGLGVDASVLFVRSPGALAADLDRAGVHYDVFGTKRVQEVLLRPRRFARAVAGLGPDGVLLPSLGHLAPALRLGGYRAPIVAMEHGILLLLPRMPLWWRSAHKVERRVSARYVDAQTAVSRFMEQELLRAPHARRVEVIENGVDLKRFPYEEPAKAGHVTFGFASRLIPGKGIPELLAAFGRVREQVPGALLRIAGDGPERESVAASAGPGVELCGVVDDMPSFWAESDVAVMPSTAPESFGMAALEAMATGRPVVATRNGGTDDLVEEGVTGQLVPCGDQDALAEAMLLYARDGDLRRVHGLAGRARCEERYTLDRCARRYATLVAELGGRNLSVPTPVEAPLEEVNA